MNRMKRFISDWDQGTASNALTLLLVLCLCRTYCLTLLLKTSFLFLSYTNIIYIYQCAFLIHLSNLERVFCPFESTLHCIYTLNFLKFSTGIKHQHPYSFPHSLLFLFFSLHSLLNPRNPHLTICTKVMRKNSYIFKFKMWHWKWLFCEW